MLKVKSLLKKFLSLGTGGSEPHNAKAGLVRAPVHLALFGVPSVVVIALTPPGPWKWLPAGILVAQAVRGEWDDVANGEDTLGKAVLDALTQAGPAVVAAIL